MILDNFSNYKINCIFLKPTLYCNLKCDYCYCYRGSKKSVPLNIMPLSTIERIIFEYMRIAQLNHYQNINVVWHGGEPLCAGLDLFKNSIEMEKKYTNTSIKINNYIQTNATLVNDEWASFFKKNKFNIGVSIDGPQQVHNLHRKNKAGESSFKQTIEGIKILQQHDLPLGALSVITEKNYRYAKDIFNFFLELEISLVDFIPCFYYSDDLSPTPEHFGDFLISIFDLWRNESKKIKITFLDDLSKKIGEYTGDRKEQYTTICELSGHCGRNIAILTNGDVYPCECLINMEYMKLGNINESGLLEIRVRRMCW